MRGTYKHRNPELWIYDRTGKLQLPIRALKVTKLDPTEDRIKRYCPKFFAWKEFIFLVYVDEDTTEDIAKWYITMHQYRIEKERTDCVLQWRKTVKHCFTISHPKIGVIHEANFCRSLNKLLLFTLIQQ